MPEKKLEKLIKLDPECCCPWGFFHSRRHWNTAKIALATGLTKRAIRYWKRKIKLGEVQCTVSFAMNCNRLRPPHVVFTEVSLQKSSSAPSAPPLETPPEPPPQDPDTDENQQCPVL